MYLFPDVLADRIKLPDSLDMMIHLRFRIILYVQYMKGL